MESNSKNDTVSVFKVMDAIEATYFQADSEGRQQMAYLIGYLAGDLGVDSSMWLRSIHARADRENDEV